MADEFSTGRFGLRRARRYLSLYGAMWRNSVVRELSFKANFILWIIVEGLWFALQLCFIGVLYLHTRSIATWSKWQVVMLVGASQFIQQMFSAFFLSNCTQLSEYVRTGKLDFMLLLPVNPRFVVSLRLVDLGGFVNAATGIGVMGYAAWRMHYVPSALQVAGFLVLCLAGLLVHYSLMFMLASVSFWTVRAQGIVWGYYNLFNIARWPEDVFHGLFKAFFSYAIPVLLVVNVPVKMLLEKLSSPWQMVLLVVLSGFCFCVSEAVWRFSLRHYTSASS